MKLPMRGIASLLLGTCIALFPLGLRAQVEPLGIVIMHGKGGSPDHHVAALARALERNGYLVANLEMPWSGRLAFSLPVARAEEDVDFAVAGLRAKGAKKVFVAGHSLGGAFVLHLAGRQTADGFIAVAPGGNVGNPAFRKYLDSAIARARALVADDRGNEAARLEDYEGNKGTYPITTVPVHYLAWHEVNGPMNMDRTAKMADPGSPILWIVPKRDYPGLRKSSPALFRRLPPNALTRLYEPDADHLGAPAASAGEIVRWTREVATATK